MGLFLSFPPTKKFHPLNAWICALKGDKLIFQGIAQDGHWVLHTL